VGDYRILTRINKQNVKQNEPLNYTVTISGKGNVKLVEEPKLNLPDGLQLYDPKISENQVIQSTVVKGSKTFEYVIIPEKAQKFKIPAIDFSFFNPKLGRYVNIRGAEQPFNVIQGDEIAPYELPEASNKGFQNIILDSLSLSNNKRYFFGSIPFWLLFALPFFVFPAFFSYHKKQEQANADVVGRRQRGAVSVAQKRLTKAKMHMDQKEKKPFYDEVIHTIWGFLGDKVGLKPSELSKENIAHILSTKGVNQATNDQLIKTIGYCEMALFAPVPDADNLQGTYDNAIDLITSLEEQLET